MDKEVQQMEGSYIALLRKEKDSDYGVEFPDFPGCVSGARTLDEARTAAQEALELHLEGMAAEVQPIPEPSSLDAIFSGDWDTEGTIPFLVTPKEPETRVMRVNVTFKPRVLRVLDGFAESHGLTRAAALERAVDAVTRQRSSEGSRGRRVSSARAKRGKGASRVVKALRRKRK